jgi:hypothetical protein
MTFLIGPDGRIVAHDLGGADLEAVRRSPGEPQTLPCANQNNPAPRPPFPHGASRSMSQPRSWRVYRRRSCSRFGRPCHNSIDSGTRR